MQINEGGNVFKDAQGKPLTQRINRADVPATVAWLEKVTGIEFPKDTVPIIYLPGVSRATLRATEECPNELKPMAELQYRGVIWSQANGKDWTLSAYLQNEKGGLGLTVARDQGTGTSLRRAIEKLADIFD